MTVGHSEQEGEAIRRRITYAFASMAAKRRTRWKLASACIATPVPRAASGAELQVPAMRGAVAEVAATSVAMR